MEWNCQCHSWNKGLNVETTPILRGLSSSNLNQFSMINHLSITCGISLVLLASYKQLLYSH